VFDLHGREIYEIEQTDRHLQINIAGHVPGLYFIRAENASGLQSGRVMLE
jgi:hypothetical protein